MIWARDTIKPWKIANPKDYHDWCKKNVVDSTEWKKTANCFRETFKIVFGNEREARYTWMVTCLGEFWLLYSYFIGSTINDVFGTSALEHKNKIVKLLTPVLIQRFAPVIQESVGDVELSGNLFNFSSNWFKVIF